MMRATFCQKHGPRRGDLTREEVVEALQKPDGVLWVNLAQPTEEELHTVLRDIFHFHPLAIEDTESTNYQPPKVDNFGDYLFIITHALRPGSWHEELKTLELDCFLGPNYLVTAYTSAEMPPVQAAWQRLERNERLIDRGADFLCHAVLDQVVDEYLPVIYAMDDEIDQIADEALVRPDQAMLERILDIKHSTLTLRRVALPQREIFNRLSRDDLPLISAENRIYYRDIYDHMVRIYDLSETVREIVTGTLDIYLSASSNRLNEVMKALTIVATIFLPLTFVTGLYGMNFEFMPELEWRYGYLMVWGVVLIVSGVMLGFFRRKGWL